MNARLKERDYYKAQYEDSLTKDEKQKLEVQTLEEKIVLLEKLNAKSEQIDAEQEEIKRSYRESVDAFKARVAELEKKLDAAMRQRKVWFGLGAAAGAIATHEAEN